MSMRGLILSSEKKKRRRARSRRSVKKSVFSFMVSSINSLKCRRPSSALMITTILSRNTVLMLKSSLKFFRNNTKGVKKRQMNNLSVFSRPRKNLTS
jgi:hypothetical protein